MKRKWSGIAAVCVVCCAASCGATNKRTEYTLLKNAQSKIENGTFSRQDATACERYARTSKNNADTFRLLMAVYQRRILGYPAKSLDILASAIFDPTEYADWKKRNESAYAEKLKTYQRELGAWNLTSRKNPKAVPPPPPSMPADIQVELPPPDKWTIDNKTVRFAIEGVNCLCDAGKYQEALKIIDRIGKNTDTVGRIYAAESAGDLFLGMRMLTKSLDMYKAAMNFTSMHKSQFSPGEEELRKVFEAEIAVAVKRIAAKCAKVTKLLEIEKYGPEWVLYKDAEILRKQKKRFFAALTKYSELSKTAKETMFGDAAEFATIKTFFALADKDGVKVLADEAAEMIATLEQKKQVRRNLAFQAPSPSKLTKLDDEIAAMSSSLQNLKALPTGKNAGAEALRRSEIFLAGNKFGLYRGEVLFECGNYQLEGKYDVKAAIEAYTKSKEWCDAALKLDKELNAFPIPEKPASISAPPKTMKKRDDWGNIDWAIPAPGKLFNRRTANWYLGYLRIMSGTKLALAYFIDGKKEEAIDELWVITAFDEEEKKQWKIGMPNSYSRLRRGFEDGRLFATQEDIRHFESIAKIQLLTADYYYELEQWLEAKKRYTRIYEEHYDRLSTTAKAYLDLVRAHCEMLTGGYKTAFPMFKKFETQYEHTPSWNRALSVLASYYQNKPETYDKAEATLWKIYNKMPDTPKGRHTLVLIGIFNHCKGRNEKAIEAFTLCQEKCPEYKKAVDHYLSKIEKEKADELLKREASTP